MIAGIVERLVEWLKDSYAAIRLVPFIYAQSRGQLFYFSGASDWLLDRVVTLEHSDDEETQEMIEAARAEQARRVMRADMNGI